MSREVPFDEEAICDECGAKGAYDFMGDCFCVECLEAFDKKAPIKNHKWAWCKVCQVATVICGSCGNNMCNGRENCNKCKSAMEMLQNTKPPIHLRIKEYLSYYFTRFCRFAEKLVIKGNKYG